MKKLTKVISLTAASFALSTAYAQGMGNSATTSDTSAMSTETATTTSVTQDRESIRRAQEQLRSRGYPVGRVDGNMGPRTSQAIRDFQSAQGISSTGQLDQQTLSALGSSSTPGQATGTGTGTTSGSQMGRSTTSDQTVDQPGMGSGTQQGQGRSPTDSTDDTTSPGGQ